MDTQASTDTLESLLSRSLRRGDVTLRNIRMDKKHFDEEVAMLLDIINDAWSDNWGFVHMTKAEIDDLAGVLKLLLKARRRRDRGISGQARRLRGDISKSQ